MAELLYESKNAYGIMDDAEKKKMNEYCEKYKLFLDIGKTDRLAAAEIVRQAEEKGFEKFEDGKKYVAGDKIYHLQKNHAVILAVIGKKSPEEGFNITAAHIDSPRLDLKPNPLYEDGEMAFFKTHYYGGILKYQWHAIPLALCGVVCKKDGTNIDVNIGLDENDPVFCITDLLPHLGKDINTKPVNQAFPAEGLNLLLGSEPAVNEDKDPVKIKVLQLLNEKYGITEGDFLTSELTIVPADKARDLGFDRSLIASYGHDDRVCAHPCVTSILGLENPEKTAVAVLTDKEEIGSVGITGLRSDYMTNFLLALCDGYNWRKAFSNSSAVSADVAAAYDPNFAEVFDKRNAAMVNHGPAICKYTGHGGKSGASDAQPEFMARLAGIFDRFNIPYQFCEMGKVDVGGGGTVSQFIADRNIEVLDIGVAMLCMHAPYEIAAKADIYMMHKLCKAFYENN